MIEVRRKGSGAALAVVTVAFPALAAGGAAAQDMLAPALPAPWAGATAPSVERWAREDAGAPAPPFRLTGDRETRDRAVGCLAAAVYYEAGDQPLAGREAVAQVVLNRVRHPHYPKSVCGVVYQGAPHPGCQFTFACDGSTARAPDLRGWRDATAVAERALDGFVAASVGASTHYHALYVRPAWSAEMRPASRIGLHVFYRFPGGLGEAGALTGVYAGAEPTPPILLASARRNGRTTAIEATPEPIPQAAAFSVWGLEVAVVTPGSGGLAVAPAASGPAVQDRPDPRPAAGPRLALAAGGTPVS